MAASAKLLRNRGFHVDYPGHAHLLPDEDPNDLVALDAAWEEEEVTFGPAAAAAAQCGKDGLAAKVRAARRPAPGVPAPESKRPIITTSVSNRA